MRVRTYLVGMLLCVVAFAPDARSQETAAQALAPTGRLRVALQVTNPVVVTRDRGPIDIYGLGPELGRTLADRLRVSFQPIRYATVPQLLAAAHSDIWDVTFLTVDPERAKSVDYTAPFLQVENSFLISPASPVTSVRNADAEGIRIAVIEGSSNSLLLARTLKSAQLVRAKDIDTALELLRRGQVDAFGDNRQLGLRVAERVPGGRVLEQRYGVGQYAMAVPKGNVVGLKYLSEFLDREKRSSHVEYTIAREKLRGVMVIQ